MPRPTASTSPSRVRQSVRPGDTNWERLFPGIIRQLLEGQRPIVRSDGTLTRDYLYVEDAASCYLQLAEALAARPDLRWEAFNFPPDAR